MDKSGGSNSIVWVSDPFEGSTIHIKDWMDRLDGSRPMAVEDVTVGDGGAVDQTVTANVGETIDDLPNDTCRIRSVESNGVDHRIAPVFPSN